MADTFSSLILIFCGNSILRKSPIGVIVRETCREPFNMRDDAQRHSRYGHMPLYVHVWLQSLTITPTPSTIQAQAQQVQ